MQNSDAKCIGTFKQTNPKEEDVVACMQDLFDVYKNEGDVLKKISLFSEQISKYEIDVLQTFKWIESKKEDDRKRNQKSKDDKKEGTINNVNNLDGLEVSQTKKDIKQS